jgi:peptidoglycan/xylan/chitin deacetylase (PgdA/CDA1 family)
MTDRTIPRRAVIVGAAATAVAACTSSSSKQTAPPSTTVPTDAPVTSTAAPNFHSSGPTTRPLVALTFHVSGDRALTVSLLDLLRSRQAVTTAFAVGTFVDANPDLMPRFLHDGHELANHTYTHLTFASLPHDQMNSEVVRCRDALVRTSGTGGRFFRPSGTSNGTASPSPTELDAIGAAGYAAVAGFDVDPSDYADPGAHLVASRTLDRIRAGSIVSLHAGHQGTLDALPTILDTLDQRGLRTATLSTLLPA